MPHGRVRRRGDPPKRLVPRTSAPFLMVSMRWLAVCGVHPPSRRFRLHCVSARPAFAEAMAWQASRRDERSARPTAFIERFAVVR